MNNSQEKKYSISLKFPTTLWGDKESYEWIPHERQPMSLFSVINENRELFQEINDDFWINHVEPFFIANDKRKLKIFYARPSSPLTKSGYWVGLEEDEPTYSTNTPVSLAFNDKKLDYQDYIYDRAEKAFDAGLIAGGFHVDTVKNGLLMFISSDVENTSKFITILDLRNKLFALPLSSLQTIEAGGDFSNYMSGYQYEDGHGGETCDILKDYSNFQTSYGFDTDQTWGHNPLMVYNMAWLLIGRELNPIDDNILGAFSDEFKITDFFKDLLPDGFMSYVNKERAKNTKIKLPKKLNNKMDFAIWKNIVSNKKITSKSFNQFISVFGAWNKSKNPYFFEAMNFLLNTDEKLHTRVYFSDFISYEQDIYFVSEISDKIHPFWFKQNFDVLKESILRHTDEKIVVDTVFDYTTMKDGKVNTLPWKIQKFFNICYSIYLLDNSNIDANDKSEMEIFASAYKVWFVNFNNCADWHLEDWTAGNSVLGKLDPFFSDLWSKNYKKT